MALRSLLGPLAALLLASCTPGETYIVEGTVVEKTSETRVVVDHEPVAGFMDAMVMPFDVRDPAQLTSVEAGDHIVARLRVVEGESWLERIRVTEKGTGAPAVVAGPAPLGLGEVLPAVEIEVTGGERWTVGAGQGRATAVTFLYTRCPLPELCPATVARLGALQEAVGGGPRLLAVTLDPDHDTLAVLEDYGAKVGARPEIWRFGRVDRAVLDDLAARAGLVVLEEGGQILHGHRMLVLDAEGRLVERYDDLRWPLDRVVSQLREGEPAASGPLGTVYPEPDP